MILIKIDFWQGYTLTDVLNKLRENGIKHSLKKSSGSGNYIFTIQVEDKLHTKVDNISDDLVLKNYKLNFESISDNFTKDLKKIYYVKQENNALLFNTNEIFDEVLSDINNILLANSDVEITDIEIQG